MNSSGTSLMRGDPDASTSKRSRRSSLPWFSAAAWRARHVESASSSDCGRPIRSSTDRRSCSKRPASTVRTESFRILQLVATQIPNLPSSLDSVELGHTNPEVVIAGLIDRWSGGTAQFGEVGTSPSIAQLMATSLPVVRRPYRRSTRPRTSACPRPRHRSRSRCDRAAFACALASNGRSPFRVSGQDVDGLAVAIAKLRPYRIHVQGPHIQPGYSLIDYAFPTGRPTWFSLTLRRIKSPNGRDDRSWGHDPRRRHAPPDPRNATGACI